MKTKILVGVLTLNASVLAAFADGPNFASGFRVGEVSQTDAILWARLTAKPDRNWDGVVPSPLMSPTRVFVDMPDIPTSEWEGAVPGLAGEIRAGLAPSPDFKQVRWTEWAQVGADADFSHQFHLDALTPATRYYLVVEGRTPDGVTARSPVGTFRTAPPPEQSEEVWFAVVTCQLYYQRDAREGFRIYRSMANLSPVFLGYPDFLVSTGDSVYYDRDNPRGRTPDLCRLHWQRMYSLPLLRDFFRNVPGYWEKDDHDTYFDDCYPGIDAPWIKPLTWGDGIRVFREQVPVGSVPYRTFRWGRDVQIWLTENREFRSPDEAPDGPKKTIWGAEQKAWLERSLLESDATFKVLISPDAIVGPDNADQSDNHSNDSFRIEGGNFRRWTMEKGLSNLYVIAGDRHWQYASTDPKTGLREFACGPTSDAMVLKGPGYEPNIHSFYRAGGGFVSVSVKKDTKKVLANPQRIVVEPGAPVITFRIHDVDGRILYEYRDIAKAPR